MPNTDFNLNSNLFDKLRALQAHLQSSINFSQLNITVKSQEKICVPFGCSKCYWTLLKTLLHVEKIICNHSFSR